MRIEEQVPFAHLTTFKVGGVARYVVTVESEDELPQVAAFAKEKGLPLIPLGGGSNMLGPDGVCEAVFVRLSDDRVAVSGDTIVASAGASWDELVARAVTERLWGLENLSGIPGTVGGALVQNAGAYGAVLSDTLVRADAFDTHTLAFVSFERDACVFGYRTSIFKTERDRYILVSATFLLTKRPAPNIGYKDLAARFAGTQPSLDELRSAVLDIRSKKFPPLDTYGTAGSFFLNPVVSEGEALRMKALHPDMPLFEMPEGGVKVPIGWHFEHVLKLRGFREGRVEAWREQALVLVAHPGATSSAVRDFAKKISERAERELGIKISPEVRLL